MSMPNDPLPPLTRGDRRFLAVALGGALVASACWWVVAGGTRGDDRGGLVEIDEAPARPAVFEVDINRAAWPELAQLPGVGETMARRIVAYREQAGPFAAHDHLCRVHGIGPKLLARVRPYLRPLGRSQSVVVR